MAIQPVQMNVDNTKSQQPLKQKKVVKPYLEAEGSVKTDNLVKPLPPIGHLVKDDFISGTKYFFKDIAYDMKAIKDGFNGTANDHQLGRLNDVGLKLGGLGIATYLASVTTNPKVRLMEYVGLATFLTSMEVYPKLAIYAPAKLKHGFDVGQEYIDDQGRKKSVLQDGNYIPFDMYQANASDEDLMAIADKMGIPKDAKNRKEIAKEHIRKTAIQNNTLWMMTAGFATPIMTALICSGLEKYVVAPSLEKKRNGMHNKSIAEALKLTNDMKIDLAEDYSNSLSKKVSKLIESYKGKELPAEDVKALIEMITDGLDNEATVGIKEDITKLLKNGKNGESFVIDSETIEKSLESMKSKLGKNQRVKYENILVPTQAEIENIIKTISKDANFENGVVLNTDEMDKLKKAVQDLMDSKIATSDGNKAFMKSVKNKMIQGEFVEFKKVPSNILTDETLSKLINFAKVIGDFKEMNTKLLKCESFKFEFAPETVLARSYEKFESTFIKELGFTNKEMKIMRESKEYATELIDKKLSELAKDDSRYKDVLSKLSKIITEMESSLHGNVENESAIKDLITAYENNYNKTAQRLEKLGGDDFARSIKKLVAQDPSTLKPSITSINDLYAWLDGINVSLVKELDEEMAKIAHLDYNSPEKFAIREKYAIAHSKELGSSKKLVLDRLRARYAGVRNSYNRVIHVLDLYRRSLKPEEFAKEISILSQKPEYIEELIKKGKKAVLNAYTADFILKNETTNNPELFIDFMNSVFSNSNEIAGHGQMSKATKEALANNKNVAGGSVLDRFGTYLTRFRNILGNDTVDFTRKKHIINEMLKSMYHRDVCTSESRFNLVAKSPVDMVREGSAKKYGSNKWFKIVASIGGTVFGVALLAQLGFGKIRNPHKIEKQVKNESN